MKLSLRFLYMLPVLAVVFTDTVFTELVFPPEGSPVLDQYSMALLAGSFGLTVLYYRYMEVAMQRWLLVMGAALGALALESYAGWHTWMVYPHVFGKFLIMIHLFSVYGFTRRFGMPPLGLLVGVILAGLLANLVFFHPDSLSMSAFVANERGFTSTGAMLMLLPTLYYFNQYLTVGGLARLLMFFMCAALIIFLQHRSVWISMGVALALNSALLALKRVEGARLSSARLMPMFLIPVFVAISGGVVVLSDPHVVKRLETSLEDIMHADKQGTGSWRLQQFESYKPFLKEYPIAGMRLKGFELPMQFYSFGTDEPVWKDRTGHHFHSFYVDRLFYFGGLGLLLTVLVPVLLLGRRLLSPAPLPPGSVALVLFSLSTLIYGISYDWAMYFFALLGLSLAAAAEPSRVPVTQRVPAPSRRQPLSDLLPFPSPRHANAATSVARR